MKAYRPFFVILSLVLIVGLACSIGINTTSTPTQEGKTTSPTAEQSSPQATTAPQSAEGAINKLTDVEKAVVQIVSQGTFIDPQVGLVVNGAGSGSGFIIDPSGIAVTNNHVVTGSALLTVYLNGEKHNAQILGASECADLAVIKIDGGPYPYLQWYSGPIQTGLEVYAAGFPLGEPQFSLTKGIISKEKADGQTTWNSLDHVLMHDATINPGNSGGPLISGDGKVIGINYSAIKSANQYFAIDETTAQPVITQLETGKDIESIGINGTAVRSDDGSFSGIWVASVKSGSPADWTGIKPGDIIYQMEGLVLSTDGTMKDYCSILRTHKPSDTLSLTVIRYASGELLEGQLNGRALTVTKKFNVSGGNSNNTNNNNNAAPGAAYTADFTKDIGDYESFILDGSTSQQIQDKSLLPFVKNGALEFNLNQKDKYVYTYYKPATYSDVRLDMTAENRGKNNNSVSLFCRYSPDDGWYEANVNNNGMLSILAYTMSDHSYHNVYNGASTLIKTGINANTYAFTCKGQILTLEINGKVVKEIKDVHYNLKSGLVGMSVSSYNVLPIIVDIQSFSISLP